MSTIVTSNVSDGTLSIPTTYVTNGSAKAWVNFNGTGTIAARDSFNVTSLTDNGTGNYSANLTSAMGNGNYGFFGFSRTPSAGNARGVGAVTSKTTTSFTFLTVYVGSVGGIGVTIDDAEIDAMILGDLA